MIDVVIPPLRFVKAFNRSPWNSLAIIGDIETPVLFISGLLDEIVPPTHVKRLHDAAVKCRIRHFHVVEDGTHNDTWYRGGGQYRLAIRSFVDTVVSSTPPPPIERFDGFQGVDDEVVSSGDELEGDDGSSDVHADL